LWAFQRSKLDCNNPRTALVLGKSRVQLGFSLAAFKERYPGWSIIQLAIADGSASTAILHDIAFNTRFKGVVFCSVESRCFRGSSRYAQQDYVDYYYKKANLNDALNCRISTFLQKRLVVMNPYLGFKDAVKHLVINGEFSKPQFITMDEYRNYYGDFTKKPAYRKNLEIIKVERREARKIKKIPKGRKPFKNHFYQVGLNADPEHRWFWEAMEVVDMAEQITGRGGSVVFIHFPMGPGFWRGRQAEYPKDRFWDRLDINTSIEMIHFLDVETLQAFKCPDQSHLDFRDAPLFTRTLLEEMEHRGILPHQDTPVTGKISRAKARKIISLVKEPVTENKKLDRGFRLVKAYTGSTYELIKLNFLIKRQTGPVHPADYSVRLLLIDSKKDIHWEQSSILIKKGTPLKHGEFLLFSMVIPESIFKAALPAGIKKVKIRFTAGKRIIARMAVPIGRLVASAVR
jgi:hypothetical protein